MGRGTGSVRLRGAPRRNIHNKWVMRVTLPRVGCATEREIEDSFTGGAGADWAWWSERSSKPSGARKGLGGFDSHTLPPRPAPPPHLAPATDLSKCGFSTARQNVRMAAWSNSAAAKPGSDPDKSARP